LTTLHNDSAEKNELE